MSKFSEYYKDFIKHNTGCESITELVGAHRRLKQDIINIIRSNCYDGAGQSNQRLLDYASKLEKGEK